MDDREELRRLIDVIEKGSGSGSLEQAVDDIKTFANTASFLANKLDTRLKGGEVKAKKQPKSRMGKAICDSAHTNSTTPSSPTEPSSTNTSGMPTATSTSTSQADFERLKPQGRNHPLGQVDRSGVCCRLCCGLRGSTCHGPLSVAANAGWWITQGFGVQLHGFGQKKCV